MKLLLFILFTQLLTAQNRMLIITIDPSRIIETNYDKGIDISLTLILDKKAFIEPLIKFEAFPNIDFYKMSVGGLYTVQLNEMEINFELFILSFYLEFSAGIEIGLIHRKKPNLKSYGSWFSPGVNFQTRLFIVERLPLIANYNIQRRTDFAMYGTKTENRGSLFIGVGYLF